ncbi:MAG: DUF1624 domain-containing protein [Bacteroides sp.]|nr:DUF1624 domain-containing protein [Bacteroides sp.]
MKENSKRLMSLDVLRGLTVAGMILVNNSGGRNTFAPLHHADWNGLTPCDLVFPFFLFMVGISTYLSLNKFHFIVSGGVIRKIFKRTVVILLIGWAIHWFGNACGGDFFPFDHLRLTGVLPRIAVCYCIVSLFALYGNHRHTLSIAMLLLIGYAILLLSGNGYINDESNILAIGDRNLIGESHLYTKRPIDPEGLVSTIGAIAHTLIGFHCGKLISRTHKTDEKVLQLFLIGFVITAIGLLFTFALPLNKRIWSPTFVLVTCGLAASLLALFMYIIDIKGKKSWARFFLIFGVNPLFLYVGSEVLAIVFGHTGLKTSIYNGISSLMGDGCVASATYAIGFMLLLGAIGYPLWKKKIYIKI